MAALAVLASVPMVAVAFVVPHRPLFFPLPTTTTTTCLFESSSSSSDDVLDQAIAMMMGDGSGHGELETPDMVQGRIQALVDEHPVLLFMKGAKRFPQCGFSDTATKILDRFIEEIEQFQDYHTVDVLSDDKVREGVKMYSEWPTIPQLYVGGEFIGGSDIMLEMYENGELKQLIATVFEKEE